VSNGEAKPSGHEATQETARQVYWEGMWEKAEIQFWEVLINKCGILPRWQFPKNSELQL
jgi:hypothetical protein